MRTWCWWVGALPCAVLLGSVFAGCVGSDPGSEPNPDPGDPCHSDGECKTGRVCSDGECVPNSSAASSSSGSTPPPDAGGGGGGGGCTPTDTACDSSAECCDFQNGNGWCADTGDGFGYMCSVECSSGSDCQSGCCVLLENNASVCSGAAACE